MNYNYFAFSYVNNNIKFNNVKINEYKIKPVLDHMTVVNILKLFLTFKGRITMLNVDDETSFEKKKFM